MKLKNAAGICACIWTVIATTACHTKAPAADRVSILYVAPAMQDGVGMGPVTCMMVKHAPDADYQLFCSRIEGFDYVPGFEYKLRVRVTELEDVPADASPYVYELIEVVSRKSAGLALEGVKWVWDDRIPGSQVDALFTDGQLAGNGGVNRYFSGYALDGSSIRIGQTGSAQMAGPQALMDQEQAFLKALGESSKYRIVGEELRLFNAKGNLVLRMVPAVDPGLDAGIWRASGINNGKGGVVSLLADTEVTARFEETGTVSGFSGCNDFSGTYAVDGPSLKIGPLAGTRRICTQPAGIMEQEAVFLRALEKTSAFRIDGEQLELRDENGSLQVKFILSD